MAEFCPALFPFYDYTERQLLMVLSIFDEIMVFQPWYTDGLEHIKSSPYSGCIHLKNPPFERKPERDFRELLPEYYSWMKENPDKAVRESLKIQQAGESGEEKTWAIKKVLRRGGHETAFLDHDKFFTQHLVLYLAQETERQRRELDAKISHLKEKDSLLEGLIEETSQERGFLNDLQSFETESIMHDSRFTSVISAWFDLFGDSLGESQPLVTLERPPFDLLRYRLSEIKAGDGTPLLISRTRTFPDLSAFNLLEIQSRKKRNPLKDIVADFLMELGDPSTLSESQNPKGDERSGTVKLKDFEPYPKASLRLEMVYIDLPEAEDGIEWPSMFNLLNRRILIHINRLS
jgi:hypothetical protein